MHGDHSSDMYATFAIVFVFVSGSEESQQIREFVYSMVSLRFQHDSPSRSNCVPGGREGNYIMFAGATSANLKNNRLFSPCSRESINDVMDVKGRCIADRCCFRGNKRKTLTGWAIKSHNGWMRKTFLDNYNHIE